MKVSVIIPAYNEEKNIGTALKYISDQEEMASEIIVVDNNSTDKTAEIAKQYGARVVKETTQGMIPARNTGFNNAKFEIIARTDADTHVPKNWIKLIRENFFKNQKLVGLSGPASFYDFPISGKLQHSQWQNKAVFAFIKSQIGHDTLYGPNMAIRKNAWEKIKNEICSDDKSVHEDTDLAIHLGRYGEIKIDPRLVVDTSFRRYRKLSTYPEYSHRLFKTFWNHDLKTYTHDTGLIDVLWKEFNPTHTTNKETVILYLPGWSLSSSSKPVGKLCQKIAEEIGIKTFAVNTKSEKPADNSLFHEALAIKRLLKDIKPDAKKIILIAHSQGTIKTIHLAHLLSNDSRWKIKGIICITPVGFYKMGGFELKIKFLGEMAKAIFGSFGELFQEDKSATNLVTSVISYIKDEVRRQTIALYNKKVNHETREITNSYPVILIKLKEIKSKIAFVLAQKDSISSSKKIKNVLEKSNLKNIHVLEQKNANHGLPYVQTQTLVGEIKTLIKDFLRN